MVSEGVVGGVGEWEWLGVDGWVRGGRWLGEWGVGGCVWMRAG